LHQRQQLNDFNDAVIHFFEIIADVILKRKFFPLKTTWILNSPKTAMIHFRFPFRMERLTHFYMSYFGFFSLQKVINLEQQMTADKITLLKRKFSLLLIIRKRLLEISIENF